MTYNDFTQRFEFDPNTDQLGAGGFGKVYKAWDRVRQEEVALKLAPVQPDMEAFSLHQEFELVRHLQHGNIAIYIDCQRMDFPFVGRHDVAWMKYYQTGHLGQLFETERLSPAQKDQLLRGILAGLEYLHTRQPFIIHRDLKPANILVVPRAGQFNPLITDFGISRQALAGGHSHITNTVKALSLHFAAPEQGDAEELRPNADLWSFGVLVAYVWRDGRLPFREQGLNLDTEAGQRQLRQRILALDLLPGAWDAVPEPWRTVAQACLVVDPKARAKSAADLRRLLGPTKPGVDPGTIVMPLTPQEVFAEGKAAAAQQNYPAAVRYYQQAADLNYAEAMMQLGVLYEHGRGVAQNQATARAWYEKAASLGHAEAKAALAALVPPPPKPPVPPPDAPARKPVPSPPASNRIPKSWLVGGGAVALGLLIAFWVYNRKGTADSTENSVGVRQSATVKVVAVQMKNVPGGTFLFGLVPAVEGTPSWREPGAPEQRQVAPFRLSSTEVTNLEWRNVLAGTKDSAAGKSPRDTCASCPVENVSKGQAEAFIAALNRLSGKIYRLPTDTEWEYAAKGGEANTANGTYSPYAGSDTYDPTSWYQENSSGAPHPRATKQANALGLYDLCGNAEEWTNTEGDRAFGGKSYYGFYVRGGSYLDPSTQRSVTFRRVLQENNKELGVGFRLAENAD